MAEINFGILDTQAPGRIAALPQQLQEQQAQNAMRLMQFKNTVQQNALAQAKIDEYKRDLAEKDVLRKLMTRPGFDIYDPKYQAEAMGVAPTLAAPIIKHAVEVKQAQARTEKDIAQTGTATTETAVKRQTFLNQAKRDLAGNPSDDNIRAWAQDAVIQKVFSPEQAEQIQANLLKVPLDQRQAMFASAGAPARQPSSMERLIAARDALPVGSPDRLAIEAQINKDLAGNRVFDPNTGLLIDRVTGQSVASGAAPAGQPGAAPLAPGIAPVQTPQAQTGGFPRVTPQVQAARDTDRLAILERELASQQAAGRVDPALQAEIANARRQAGVPANALAGAAPSVNALAGAAPSNPAERMAAYKKQLEVAGAGPEAEAKKQHELLVDQYKKISETAQLASKTLPALESNLAILDRGFTTGFGTEVKAAGAKVLGALGVQNAEKFATNSQTFLANATQSVLQRQLEQKGPQTEADAQRITQIGGQLGNTREANKFILSVAKAQLQRDIDQRKFYDQWRKQNNTYNGAEDAWFSGEGGKSLFDTPALKEYSSKTPTGGAASVTLPDGRTMNFPNAAAAAAFKKAAGL